MSAKRFLIWSSGGPPVQWSGTVYATDRERRLIMIPHLKITKNKRALGPWVAHLRMTDRWSGTICVNMVECIMRNNSVKLY